MKALETIAREIKNTLHRNSKQATTLYSHHESTLKWERGQLYKEALSYFCTRAEFYTWCTTHCTYHGKPEALSTITGLMRLTEMFTKDEFSAIGTTKCKVLSLNWLADEYPDEFAQLKAKAVFTPHGALKAEVEAIRARMYADKATAPVVQESVTHEVPVEKADTPDDHTYLLKRSADYCLEFLRIPSSIEEITLDELAGSLSIAKEPGVSKESVVTALTTVRSAMALNDFLKGSSKA